jgi:hypothetical protein
VHQIQRGNEACKIEKAAKDAQASFILSVLFQFFMFVTDEHNSE